jgi:hypothetical protein
VAAGRAVLQARWRRRRRVSSRLRRRWRRPRPR